MASDFENKDDAVTPGQDAPAQEAAKPEGKPEGGRGRAKAADKDKTAADKAAADPKPAPEAKTAVESRPEADPRSTGGGERTCGDR